MNRGGFYICGAVALLLVLASAVSLYRGCFLAVPSGHAIGVERACLIVLFARPEWMPQFRTRRLVVVEQSGLPLSIGLPMVELGRFGWAIGIPMWIGIAAAGGAALGCRFMFACSSTRSTCPQCRYDLRGLRSSTCPECGASLNCTSTVNDPADRRTTHGEQGSKDGRMHTRC